MAHVFLCHALENTEVAQEIANFIQSDKNLDIWTTHSEDLADEARYENTVQLIEKSRQFILLWSKAASISPEVMFEWTNALNIHQYLVICRLDGTKLPEALSNHILINFTNIEKGLPKLAKYLPANDLPEKPSDGLDLTLTSEPAPELDSAEILVSEPEKKPEMELEADNEKEHDISKPIIVGTASKPEQSYVPSAGFDKASFALDEAEMQAANEFAMKSSSNWESKPIKAIKKKKQGWYRIELIIPGIILTVLIGLIMLILFKRSQKAPEFRVISSVLTENDVRALIRSRNFYALDWNDNGAGYPNSYEIKDVNGDKIIIDEKSGLTWQQAGSSKPVPVKEVQHYIKELNQRNFAGFDNWRLPTLQEAMTLVEPYTNIQELHIDPIFKGIWCIWTMDVDQEGHRWAVNFYTRPGTGYDKNVYIRACR